MLFNVFARELLGRGATKLMRYALICAAVFAGLKLAEVRVAISPEVKALMPGVFTAGVMWQALSTDNAAALSGVMMLPVGKRAFTLSYVGAHGLYAVAGKTALLVSVMCAVSLPTWAEAAGMLCGVVCGVTVSAAVYAMRRRLPGLVWGAGCVASAFAPGAAALLAAHAAAGVAVLLQADPYRFINRPASGAAPRQAHRYSVWRYLWRYMAARRNYLVNTAALWLMAAVLPGFLLDSVGAAFLPMGYAVLCINTPLCALISADPALGEALRFLPGGARRFCVPYGGFIALSTLTGYGVYLASFALQGAAITPVHVALALLFALLGAAGAVIMELKFPLTGWKTLSDLWHHPRKYAVPAVLLVLAMAACAL